MTKISDADRRRCEKFAIHVVVWVLYTVFEALILFFAVGKINPWETFFNLSINAGLFYLNILLLLPMFFSRKKYISFSFYFLLSLCFFIAIKYFSTAYIVPLFNYDLIYPYTDLKAFLSQVIWRASHFTIFGFGYWFATSLIKSEREKNKLEQQKLEDQQQLQIMDKSLRDAEMAFLKNQINPHFLFNTLNFIYEQVQSCSQSAAEGILMLSSIMRYALKEPKVNSKVMLNDEVHHLRSYISINQLRFNHQLQIQFTVSGNTQFRMIIPFVLITFVENCFKYGELYDPEHPLLIHLEIKDDMLFFSTYNKKKIGPIEHSNGIGLSNTRKRLEIVYGSRCDLFIHDEPKFYTLRLTIKL